MWSDALRIVKEYLPNKARMSTFTHTYTCIMRVIF